MSSRASATVRLCHDGCDRFVGSTVGAPLGTGLDGRPIARFWFLETVARMPYFSYSAMLTVYELLGWWRRGSELRRVHFAEDGSGDVAVLGVAFVGFG